MRLGDFDDFEKEGSDYGEQHGAMSFNSHSGKQGRY